VPSAKEVLRFLRKNGYTQQRQTGSHIILKHSKRPMLVVPFHRGEIPRGLFLRILKDGGFSEEEFIKG
jgi:predicted RNA binding protein YcfA (HicA-like mRNA interferase family)